MEKSSYISRLHCHQKVLLRLLEESLRAESYSEKKAVVKRARKMTRELLTDRFDYYVKLHVFQADTWSEIITDFLHFLRQLIRR